MRPRYTDFELTMWLGLIAFCIIQAAVTGIHNNDITEIDVNQRLAALTVEDWRQ